MRRLLSALSVGALVVLGTATPALGADDIALIVEPQTVEAGGVIKLTASNCKRSSVSVTVNPSSLGSVTLRDPMGNDSVSGQLTIPGGARPGMYTVTAQCSGSDHRADQSLYVYKPAPEPHKAPATGGIALGSGSSTTMLTAGAGAAALGGVLGVLAWRRRSRPVSESAR